MVGIGAAAKVGLGALRSMYSPVGLCIISVLFIILTGFNPIFMGFDLIIKSMNILSGNALIQQIVNGVFDPSSPIFIIYITIFLVSFLLIFFKLIKNSLGDIATNKEFKSNQNHKTPTMSFSKLKWILIWFIVWIALPFAFGVFMFIINLFADLFALAPLSINTLFTLQPDSWDKSLNLLRASLNDEQAKIDIFLNTFFPNNINDVVVVPPEFEIQGMTIDTWKDFLKNLVTNTNAINFKNSLDRLDNRIDAIFLLPIWDISSSALIDKPINESTILINNLINAINGVNQFINNKEINVNNLEIAFSDISNSMNFGTETKQLFLKTVTDLDLIIKYVPVNLINTFNSTDLFGIASFGVEGQRESINNIDIYRPETLTCKLASALYQQRISGFSMSISSISDSVSNIPIIGTVITLISNVSSILSNPLTLFDLIIPTFGFAFCFTSFWSILLIFAARLFDFLSMIVIAPFSAASGLNDNGEKFQVWFKTFFGKALMVFVISLTISIFIVCVDVVASFIKPENLGDYVENSTFFVSLICKFLLMVMVIATCGGMLEFIGWAGQMLSIDSKAQRYRNGFTQRKMNTINNVQNGLDQAQKQKLAAANGKDTTSSSRATSKTGSPVSPVI